MVAEPDPQGGQGRDAVVGRSVGTAQLEGAADPDVRPELREVTGPVGRGHRRAVVEAAGQQVGEGPVRGGPVAAVRRPVVDHRNPQRPVDDIVDAHVRAQCGLQEAAPPRVHPQPVVRTVRQHPVRTAAGDRRVDQQGGDHRGSRDQHPEFAGEVRRREVVQVHLGGERHRHDRGGPAGRFAGAGEVVPHHGAAAHRDPGDGVQLLEGQLGARQQRQAEAVGQRRQPAQRGLGLGHRPAQADDRGGGVLQLAAVLQGELAAVGQGDAGQPAGVGLRFAAPLGERRREDGPNAAGALVPCGAAGPRVDQAVLDLQSDAFDGRAGAGEGGAQLLAVQRGRAGAARSGSAGHATLVVRSIAT